MKSQPGLLVESDLRELPVCLREAEAVQCHVPRRDLADLAPTDRAAQRTFAAACNTNRAQNVCQEFPAKDDVGTQNVGKMGEEVFDHGCVVVNFRRSRIGGGCGGPFRSLDMAPDGLIYEAAVRRELSEAEPPSPVEPTLAALRKQAAAVMHAVRETRLGGRALDEAMAKLEVEHDVITAPVLQDGIAYIVSVR